MDARGSKCVGSRWRMSFFCGILTVYFWVDGVSFKGHPGKGEKDVCCILASCDF